MGKLLLSHRSTKYPCFVPNLGESMGAGRKRLTHGKSKKKINVIKVIYSYHVYKVDYQRKKLHFVICKFSFEGKIAKYS